MISTVIVTFNESEKLNNCLSSIKDFADEIVVVDLESNDETKKIAEKYQTKFFSHPPVPYVELVRNYAISKASGDWILILDPDESLTQDLKEKLKNISEKEEFIAVNIPRKNIFFGKWISHTNWWPDRQVRFFKKDKVHWSDVIHKYPEVDGRTLNLEAKEKLAIIHQGYFSVKEFFSRQNRYSTIDAENKFKAGSKFSFTKLLWFPLREFFARYVKHLGFLDGFYGFSLVVLIMVYQLSVWTKVWELEKTKKV